MSKTDTIPPPHEPTLTYFQRLEKKTGMHKEEGQEI